MDNTESRAAGRDYREVTVQGQGTYVEGDLYQLPKPAPTPTGTPHNLDRSSAHFVGRDDEIAQLHHQLHRSDRLAIAAAIAGMGGVGKTELALQYAFSHLSQGTYPGGLCWLRARAADIGSQVVSFARTKLGLNLPDDLELVEQVDFCWQHWQQGDALIIFDDVIDYERVEPFLPPGEKRFKVLFTTRLHLGKTVEELRLDVLSEAAAIGLLGKLAGEERVQKQLDDAKALCSWVGYLPLGVELVGRYLEGKPDLTLATMQQRLEGKGLEAKALVKAEAGMTANLGVAAAFELSWRELNDNKLAQQTPAQQLGCLLSLFALAPIPWSLVESVVEQLQDEAIIPSDSEELEDLRDETLLKLHLLQRTGNGVYQLHQLIREFFIAKQREADALKRGYCRAMVQEAQSIPQTPTRDLIADVVPAIPHIGEAATGLQNWLDDEDLGWPFTGIGFFYMGQGAYSESANWFERCLSVVRDRVGEGHPSVATSYNNLALLYSSQGRYEEAEPLYRKALEMGQQLLGEGHPSVATSYNNLAGLYLSQGRYEEAELLFRQALEMMQLLGEGHPSVATSYNNLAELYRAQGRYEEAEPLYLKALDIDKRVLGEDHPGTAIDLGNLGGLYYAQGRYSEVELLWQQALQIFEQRLGKDHPRTVTTRNNLEYLHSNRP